MEQCSFGDYITQEYGLLKQILSYLTVTDLRNAKLVCKKWSSAIESAVEKNPLIVNCQASQLGTFAEVLSKPILSSVIVLQNPGGCNASRKTCSGCKRAFVLCPCICSDQNTLFLTMNDNSHHPSEDSFTEQYTFWNETSVLMMPSSEKCKVSLFYEDWRSPFFKQPISEEVLRYCVGEETIKGLLVISRVNRPFSFDWINNLCNAICDRQEMTFAVGGGLTKSSNIKKGFEFSRYERWKKPGLLLLTFRGEAVSVLSDVLAYTTKSKIDIFMEQLADRAGPVPPGGSRVAFIAQCVDRIQSSLEHWESEAFQKAFPLVPQFGFQAFGEFGIRSHSSTGFDDGILRKRKRLHFEHVHTTTYLIVTFSKI